MTGVLESDLKIFTDEARIAFQLIIWPLIMVGVVGNLGVLWRICFSNSGQNSTLKPLYRSALLSLALSDLLLLASSGVNTLSALTRSTILWSLPDWACMTVPYLQTVAVLVGSLTLAGIAVDRYGAMKPKYPPTKVPKWPFAAGFIALVWCIAAAASYPVLGIYNVESVIVINETYVTYYRAKLCITVRNKAASIYTVLFAVIFLPLAVVFVVVHALLALNIWRRKSHGVRSQLASSHESQFSDASTVSTSASHTRPPSFRRAVPTPPHILRKKRTVKVILILIGIFGFCRLPLWIFLLYKLYVVLSGKIWWHLQIVLTTLSFLNVAINPFLYAFLNETLSLASWMRSCCSKKEEAQLNLPDPERRRTSITGVKVPRGPYSP